MKQFFAQNVPSSRDVMKGFSVLGTYGLFLTVEADSKESQNPVYSSLITASKHCFKSIQFEYNNKLYVAGAGGPNIVVIQQFNAGGTQGSFFNSYTVDPPAGGDYWYCAGYDASEQTLYIGGNSGSLAKRDMSGSSFSVSTPISNGIRGIAFNNIGMGVMVGDSGNIRYSNNGNTWNVCSLDGPSLPSGTIDWKDVVYNNNADRGPTGFFAIGNASGSIYIAKSTTGRAWYCSRLSSSDRPSKLVIGEGKLVAYTSTPNISTSFSSMTQSRTVYEIPDDNIGSVSSISPVAYNISQLPTHTVGDIVWDEESSKWYFTMNAGSGTAYIKSANTLSEVGSSIIMGEDFTISKSNSQTTGLIVVPTKYWAPVI